MINLLFKRNFKIKEEPVQNSTGSVTFYVLLNELNMISTHMSDSCK